MGFNGSKSRLISIIWHIIKPTKIILSTRIICYTKIYSNGHTFAALKADGSITAWGYEDTGGASGNCYTKIYSTNGAFAALKAITITRGRTSTPMTRITPCHD
jgi:hypothetical protein